MYSILFKIFVQTRYLTHTVIIPGIVKILDKLKPEGNIAKNVYVRYRPKSENKSYTKYISW